MSSEITATASELANSMVMGRSLNTIALQVGTFVLSKDPGQRRKKIMSPWVGLKMMTTTKANCRMVETTFNFLNTNYDMIPFPIYQANENEPGAQGHWFKVALNLIDKKFQVIDSLRAPNNPSLVEKAHKARAKIITLWKKYTAKHDGCTVPAVFNYELQFITGYRQFGIHDCRLFTLKAMEYWDGTRLPKIIGCSEINLRKQVLFEWIASPINKSEWKSTHCQNK